ncbi:MAG: UDP-N-acetylmuramate dehydrogenase [Pseudomonadota bacterium]|nr:UDP-N-acetylmuramate dehydrogenase [Pseudomonadota bacterium]
MESNLNITEYVNLQAYHTLATPAVARFVVVIDSHARLMTLMRTPLWQQYPHLILGAGSNTFFRNDYPGIVVHNEIKGVQIVQEDAEYVWLGVGAGENWHQLVEYCVAQNYAGIENLALIPGTVGAAPIQNIGAYGVELESVFDQLTAINLQTGEEEIFKHADCDFAYRHSVFKTAAAKHFCITHVTLRLSKTPVLHLDYGQIRSVIDAMPNALLNIQTVSAAVMSIRRSKLPDPTKLPNAGSFFKNPIISKLQFQQLETQFPTLPHYPVDDANVKIPAAWLIEQCGWRGKRQGPIGVHEHQALVIINYDHGNGEQICQLAENIKNDVRSKFNIELEMEVRVV